MLFTNQKDSCIFVRVFSTVPFDPFMATGHSTLFRLLLPPETITFTSDCVGNTMISQLVQTNAVLSPFILIWVGKSINWWLSHWSRYN